MKINKKKIEYVIGIDLGHGETSVALCHVQENDQTDQLEDAIDLDMGGNKKVLPSAITLLKDGSAYIGDAAFNPDILKQAQVHVCFKQAPKNVEGEAEKIMIRFMAEVYKLVCASNPSLITEGNHVVYIATPSGWNKEQQELYVEMAEIAGLPIAGVTKESRAAFVTAQKDVTSGIGRNVSKGAIVFDMGSSTLDFTYMNKNLPNLIDQGYDCGASFIEKDIFKKKEKEDKAIQAFEHKYPDLIDYLVFEARKVKEQVYFNTELRVKKTINFDDIIEDEDLEDERFKIAFQPGELNEMLKEDGYFKMVEDAMSDFKNNFIKGQAIYGVFMTGGASRMNFLKPLICKCWGVDEAKIFRDQDPSLTISRGVAEVARLDMQTMGLDANIGKSIDTLKKSGKVFELFASEFGDQMSDKVIEEVATVINSFKDDEDDWSLNELKDNLAYYVSEAVNEVKKNAPEVFCQTMEKATLDIRENVDKIVASYTNESTNIAIPTIDVSDIELGDINIDGVIDEISQIINVETTNWTKWILTGVGAIFGLIGMTIGYLAGKFFGEKKLTEAEKMERAMAKELNKEEREEVYGVLDEKWSDIAENIDLSIHRSISNNKDLQGSIQEKTKEVLDSYKNALKEARILID